MTPTLRRRLLLGAAVVAALATLALATGIPQRGSYRYLSVFQEVWGLTRANYVEAVNEAELLEGAYRGMLASVDAVSSYLEPGEEKLLAGTEPAGVLGIELLPAGGIPVVVRVEPGSGAERQGIAVGDQVWKIGGKSTRLVAWPVLRRMLRGTPGAPIELEVLDAKKFQMKTRALVFEANSGKGFTLLRLEGPVIALRLADPAAVVADVLRAELAAARAADPSAPLLIDLRGTTGLEPRELVRLAGVLLPGGELLKLAARAGAEEIVRAPDLPRAELPGKVFVLVDGTTAGTGEALAALLKERANGVLIGRPTYGLAGLPELIPLASGGHVLLSTRQMRTPSGVSWSEKGLEPAKILTPGQQVAKAADPLLETALAWIREGAPLAALRPAA
ncbi:MAG: S41 family peptidase [Acidobacteria bacterium]|jgi:carboxyl-terminal processing protease|nr:S41 family peptidase [Acidobacteriota bacterium]